MSIFNADEETWYLENLHEKNAIDLKDHVTIVGRSRTCDIVIEDRIISRQHFKIVLVNDHFILTDLVSWFHLFISCTTIVLLSYF